MNESPRTLVFLWTYLDWGGAQIYFIATIKRAIKDWNVVVALPRASSDEIVRYVEQAGGTVEFLNWHLDEGPAPSIARKLARQWSRITSEIRTLNYLRQFPVRSSVFHIEVAPWQSWKFLTMLALRGANVFITLHNPPSTESALRNFLWRCRMRFVTSLKKIHIFASNEFTRNEIRPLVNLAAWQQIPVTYTAIDPEQIDRVLSRPCPRDDWRDKLGIARDAFVVLTLGQFVDRKGRWILLEAAQRLIDDRSNIHFVWIAPAEPSASDVDRTRSYGLGDRFQLILSDSVGTTREEILAFFRVADIFALPSFLEGLPIALLEAMAMKIPAVSTSVYAIPEAIESEVNGSLVPAGDAIALASAIADLANDAKKRERLGAAGRETAIVKFDEREAADKALAEYARCQS